MFLNSDVRKPVDTYVARMFALHRLSIMELHGKQWNEEDIKGYSNIQYRIQQYYLAYYFALLIWYEVNEGLNKAWKYYEVKYDIDRIRKALACNNIDLDQILAVFDLPITDTLGINNIGISNTLEIAPFNEASEPVYPSVPINELLTVQYSCTSYVDGTIEQYDYSGSLIN